MDNPSCTILLHFFPVLFLIFITQSYAASDTISINQSISDGQTLISNGGSFELGFFTPPGAPLGRRYVGIWYNRAGKLVVIWVANREIPVNGTTGVLKLNATGALLIVDGNNKALWWTDMPVPANNYHAKLEDSGNFMLRNEEGQTVWQSFDERSNMIIPISDIKIDFRKNKSKPLVSWKSDSDPSMGRFSLALQSGSFVQMITYNGSVPYWRSGQWIGPKFIGIPEMRSSYANGFSLNRDESGISYRYAPSPDTSVLRLAIGPDGLLVSWIWNQTMEEWLNEWRMPEHQCDMYNTCGDFAVCNPSSPSICTCMRGFIPKSEDEWRNGNLTRGCVRETELACEKKKKNNGSSDLDGFFKLERLKLPDFAERVDPIETNVADQCAAHCMRNCSCLAYAYVGSNCMVWGERLPDVREFPWGGEDLYIKLEASELDGHGNSNKKTFVIVLPVLLGIGFCFLLCCLWWRALKVKEPNDAIVPKPCSPFRGTPQVSQIACEMGNSVSPATSLEFTLFAFDVISTATEGFNSQNKLGEGGFGSVYKGVLSDGQEIAVKRLCCGSGQGLEEFKNEVMLISKLQHRNLVRLLGCCIEEEKLLVYEFMPNRSLDAFLFGSKEKCLLDWSKRFHIIMGVAQGLLYLHRDSILKIIHRDLKASNVLLDAHLNAKIADFGTARIFDGDQILARTRRVVGTYGYMSPEYAMHGQFSEKSDVFSFGIMLLEIISGKRIGTFYHDEQGLNLLGYAWKLWNQGNIAEFIDPMLRKSWPQSNAMRCILVGLLCVQEVSTDRPPMSYVISMLTSDMADIHNPKMPAFIGRRDHSEMQLKENNETRLSVNDVTLTII